MKMKEFFRKNGTSIEAVARRLEVGRTKLDNWAKGITSPLLGDFINFAKIVKEYDESQDPMELIVLPKFYAQKPINAHAPTPKLGRPSKLLKQAIEACDDGSADLAHDSDSKLTQK